MLSVSCIKTENIIKLQRGSSKLKTALPSHDMHDELNAFRHRFLCILNQHIFFLNISHPPFREWPIILQSHVFSLLVSFLLLLLTKMWNRTKPKKKKKKYSAFKSGHCNKQKAVPKQLSSPLRAGFRPALNMPTARPHPMHLFQTQGLF